MNWNPLRWRIWPTVCLILGIVGLILLYLYGWALAYLWE